MVDSKLAVGSTGAEERMKIAPMNNLSHILEIPNILQLLKYKDHYFLWHAQERRLEHATLLAPGFRFTPESGDLVLPRRVSHHFTKEFQDRATITDEDDGVFNLMGRPVMIKSSPEVFLFCTMGKVTKTYFYSL